jgi:hypothetical protein
MDSAAAITSIAATIPNANSFSFSAESVLALAFALAFFFAVTPLRQFISGQL